MAFYGGLAVGIVYVTSLLIFRPSGGGTFVGPTEPRKKANSWRGPAGGEGRECQKAGGVTLKETVAGVTCLGGF